MTTTADTPFSSKSVSMGTTRWAFRLPEDGIVRGYVIDCAEFKLDNRWFAVTLEQAGLQGFQFRVNALGNGGAVDLDPAALKAATLGSVPVLVAPLNVTDEATAMERFERVTSNVMHKKLAPLPQVGFIWSRFATTDGTHAYRAANAPA